MIGIKTSISFITIFLVGVHSLCNQSRETCLNGGSCVNTSCKCAPGWIGERCEKNFNDCLPSPCLNDGVCTDGLNTFSCRCREGYTGKRCQINIDECILNRCLNGATCQDLVNSYSCSCAAGYFGRNCESTCSEDKPCLNYGQCTTLPERSGKHCQCQPGYNGTRCQKKVNGPLLCGSHFVSATFVNRTARSSTSGMQIVPCKNSTTCSFVHYFVMNKFKDHAFKYTKASCDYNDTYCKHFCATKEKDLQGSHLELKSCYSNCCKSDFCNLKMRVPVRKEPPTSETNTDAVDAPKQGTEL